MVSNQITTGVTLWIPGSVVRECVLEANDKYPMESGGTFMGWWSDSTTVVITQMVGHGPGALHGRDHFQPDQAWQLEHIAKQYELSGRKETYLGDWHSHPDALNGALSWTDRGVMRGIINTPSARCPTPLMMIFWGSPTSTWRLTAWQAHMTRWILLWDKLELRAIEPRIYSRNATNVH